MPPSPRSSARGKSQFRRRDANLYTTVSIGLDDALLGFEKNLIHFDDHTIALSRKGVTQPGYVETVASEGMPLREKQNESGNLYVEYNVILPDKIDGDLRKGESLPAGFVRWRLLGTRPLTLLLPCITALESVFGRKEQKRSSHTEL